MLSCIFKLKTIHLYLILFILDVLNPWLSNLRMYLRNFPCAFKNKSFILSFVHLSALDTYYSFLSATGFCPIIIHLFLLLNEHLVLSFKRKHILSTSFSVLLYSVLFIFFPYLHLHFFKY